MSWADQWRHSTREAPLHTEIRGEGEETLVFVAGLDGPTRYWNRLGPIENRYRIVLTMAACLVTRRIVGWLVSYMVKSVPREVAQDLVKHTWRSSTSSLWEVVFRHDVAGDRRNFTPSIGVVFIQGERDIMAPLAHVEELIERGSDWRRRVLHGVEHHPFLRDPHRYLTAIEGTLAIAGDSARLAASLHDA